MSSTQHLQLDLAQNQQLTDQMYITLEDEHLIDELVEMVDTQAIKLNPTGNQNGFRIEGQYTLIIYYGALFDKAALTRFINLHQVKSRREQEIIEIGYLTDYPATVVYVNWGGRKRFTGANTLMFEGFLPWVYAVNGAKHQVRLTEIIHEYDDAWTIYWKQHQLNGVCENYDTLVPLLQPQRKTRQPVTEQGKQVATVKATLKEAINPKKVPTPGDLFAGLSELPPALIEVLRTLSVTDDDKIIIYKALAAHVKQLVAGTIHRYAREQAAHRIKQQVKTLGAHELLNHPAFEVIFEEVDRDYYIRERLGFTFEQTKVDLAPIQQFTGMFKDPDGNYFHATQVRELIMKAVLDTRALDDEEYLDEDCNTFTAGQLRGMVPVEIKAEEVKTVKDTMYTNHLPTPMDTVYVDTDNTEYPPSQVYELIVRVLQDPSTPDDEEFLDEDCNTFTAGQLRGLKMVTREPVLSEPQVEISTHGVVPVGAVLDVFAFIASLNRGQTYTFEDASEYTTVSLLYKMEAIFQNTGILENTGFQTVVLSLFNTPCEDLRKDLQKEEVDMTTVMTLLAEWDQASKHKSSFCVQSTRSRRVCHLR